jgi:hypothetical protein
MTTEQMRIVGKRLQRLEYGLAALSRAHAGDGVLARQLEEMRVDVAECSEALGLRNDALPAWAVGIEADCTCSPA